MGKGAVGEAVYWSRQYKAEQSSELGVKIIGKTEKKTQR